MSRPKSNSSNHALSKGDDILTRYNKTGNSQGDCLKYKHIQMFLMKDITIGAYYIYKHCVYHGYLTIYMQSLWQYHIQPLKSTFIILRHLCKYYIIYTNNIGIWSKDQTSFSGQVILKSF